MKYCHTQLYSYLPHSTSFPLQKLVPAAAVSSLSGLLDVSDPEGEALTEDGHRCLLKHFRTEGFGKLELVKLVVSDNSLQSYFRT